MDEAENVQRPVGIANYYAKSLRDADEAKFLARQAGHKRFTHLVFAVVDAELARLREEYAVPLAEWRAAQDRIATLR